MNLTRPSCASEGHSAARFSVVKRCALVWSTLLILCMSLPMLGCGNGGEGTDTRQGDGMVLTDTSFLADIVGNVVGERFAVSALLPLGTDPHSFEPSPQDARLIAESRVVVINAAGLVPQVDDLLAAAAAPDRVVIEAAEGVVGAREDPHAWLDPNLVILYVENISAGLAAADPEGAGDYLSNAQAYSQELRDLDAWIVEQVQTIPAERRLLVTNHESFGYFAERYGFRVVGTVFPTVSGEGSPSAQQVVALVEDIRTSGAPAIFLETGGNPDLARQVAGEAGVKLVSDLCVASLTEDVRTYVDMMRWNVNRIVEALR